MATSEASDPQPKVTKRRTEEDKSCHVYPPLSGLDCKLFQLSHTALTDECQQKALEQLETYLKKQQKNFLGYQVNELVNFTEKLSFMLNMHVNNAGDPFVNGNFTLNTKVIERSVLDYFAKLWNAESPSDKANGESYWGYVLSMGSTEGNLFALYNARDYLKGKPLYKEVDENLSSARPVKDSAPSKNAYHPIAFFSQDTHYSITKIVRVLEIRTFYEVGEKEYKGQCPITADGQWPKEVPSEGGNAGPGSIDVEKLAELVTFFAKTGSPPLIVLNVGTTFKGAYDDVEKVGSRLKPILEKYKLYKRLVEYAPGKFDERTGYWIHIDGALGASYLPFLERAGNRIEKHASKFDFSLPFVHSIVTSAHKYPGCPMPSGIYMTKRKYQIAPPEDPEYIGSPDTTFAGSRNAIAPVALWCYYANTSYEIEIDRAIRAQDLAKYAETKLKELDGECQRYGYDIWVARAPLSLSLIFRDPGDAGTIFKYSLSQMTLLMEDEKEPRKYVHIFIMESVTKEKINELIEDLRQAYSRNALSIQRKLVVQHLSTTDTNGKAGIHHDTHVPLIDRKNSENLFHLLFPKNCLSTNGNIV